MFAVRTVLLLALLTFWYNFSKADDSAELQACESHLNKYRKFLLQAVLSFEDVCDAYNTRVLSATGAMDTGLPAQLAFFGHYQPPEEKTEVWSFFKLLMAQFNDVEFTNIIREAVIERCRIKFQQQQQRDEKRNSVVLGKKQRFHSWGGKRSEQEQQQQERTTNEEAY